MHRTASTVVLLSVAALASNAVAQGPLFLSLADNVDNNLPGFGPFTDEDVVCTSLDGTTASLEFGIGLGDLDAAHRLPNGNWLVSSLFNGEFGGTTFDDGDLVEINPTNGTFVSTIITDSIWDNAGADISGVSVLPNGNYLLSLLTDNAFGGTAFTDGDVIEYNATAGTASLFLAEATIFDDGDADVYGIHHFADGTLLLSASTDEVVSGTLFRDGDAFLYNPADDSATLVFSEDLFSSSGLNSWDIDALYFEGAIPTPGGVALLGLAGLAGLRRRRA